MENHTSAALKVAQGGIIAALYVVLTLVSNAFGLANGAIQVRISEALTVLPVFTPAAIPGLFAGCIISNTLTGAVLPDIIFGSLATLAAGIVTYRIRHLNRFLAPVPPILANTLVVPFVLRYAYGAEDAIPFMMLTVFAGEFISCGVLGMMLYPVMSRILRRDG
ncbi:MAG TPA: transporter [Lachnospiraceae bacterium]|nr:QueT transporter family protein [Lachnospiraceae bacterium]HAL32486.1 transporter [Lachnospiraceae bacterium]HBB59780.1 transporter [Lachnospiraceae bacterium]